MKSMKRSQDFKALSTVDLVDLCRALHWQLRHRKGQVQGLRQELISEKIRSRRAASISQGF